MELRRRLTVWYIILLWIPLIAGQVGVTITVMSSSTCRQEWRQHPYKVTKIKDPLDPMKHDYAIFILVGGLFR